MRTAQIVEAEAAAARAAEAASAVDASRAVEATEAAEAARVAEPALALAPDSPVLWSGRGREGADLAGQWAADNGGVTLEQALVNAGLNPPSWSESPAWWTAASRSFAQNATGDVRVLLGDNVNPGGIWAQTELPALKLNPNVRSITVVNPTTGEQNVIWRR